MTDRYYKIAALYPLALITAVGVISGIIHDILGIGKEYKSEWFTNDGWWESVLLAILISSFICVLSLTIFLTSYKSIKANTLLRLIIWFAAPFSVISYILTKHIQFLANYHDNSYIESIFVFTIILPHIIGMFVSYFKFGKSVKQLMLDRFKYLE